MRSLRETFAALGGGDPDLVPMLVVGLNRLLVAAALIVIFVGAYVILRRMLRAVLRRAKTGDELYGPLSLGLRYVTFLAAAIAIMAQFGIAGATLAAVARAAVVALIFYVAWMISTRLLLGMLKHYDLDRSIEQLLRNVVSVLIVAFGIVTVLSQFGFDILSVIAGLGIVGLAVGFAAQSTLANFIAGITLLLERPFRIGDWVQINGQEGKVMEIALRTTRLRTRDNIYTAIPNDSVASADIINYSSGGPLRVRIPVGIAYKEKAAAAREVIMPILRSQPEVLQDEQYPCGLTFTALGDSSLDLTILYWVNPEHIDIQPRISARILEQVKDALDEAGIEIPFPHLQLFIDEAKGLKPILEPLYAERRSAGAG
ncbi:MAG: mechanosensitive ion channel family protein [Chromatiales bacterium]|nr:mechanosensitive ion channel family protein [Chromatiales bacterium]